MLSFVRSSLFGDRSKVYHNKEYVHDPKVEQLKIGEVVQEIQNVRMSRRTFYPAHRMKVVDNWIKNMIENQPLYHGHATMQIFVQLYCSITPSQFHTAENLKHARVLGYLGDLIIALFFMIDNKDDNEISREGIECWHVKNDATLPNDALLLEAKIYDTLEYYLKDHPKYLNMLQALISIVRDGHMSHMMMESVETLRSRGEDWTESYTKETLLAFAEHKTRPYSAPLHFLPLYLANYDDPTILELFGDMLRQGAYLYTYYDDFEELYGKYEGIERKRGMDIRSGQIGLPIVLALENSNSNQKAILSENYGRGADEEAFQRVLQVYNELDLEQLMREALYDGITQLMQSASQFKSATNFPIEIYIDWFKGRKVECALEGVDSFGL